MCNIEISFSQRYLDVTIFPAAATTEQFEVFYLFFVGREINGRYSDSLRKVRCQVQSIHG